MQHTEIRPAPSANVSPASDVRRLPDHSIDYGYYWHETRQQRAAEAAHLFAKARNALRRLLHRGPASGK